MAVRQVQERLGVKQYALGSERHPETGGRHFHALFISEKIRSPHMFDIAFEGKVYKGHYEKIRRLQEIVHYVCKEEDYYTNIQAIRGGELMTKSALLQDRAKEVGVDKALLE